MTENRGPGPGPDEPTWNQPGTPPPAWGQGQPGGWQQQPGQESDWQQQPGPATGGWTPPPPPPPPYGTPPPGQPYAPYGQATPAVRRTNTMAILALVLSFLCGPVGLVLGIIGRQQARQRNEGGEGLAIAAIIIGSLWLLGGIISACAAAISGNSTTTY